MNFAPILLQFFFYFTFPEISKKPPDKSAAQLLFMESYPEAQSFESNKKTLKSKYLEAQKLSKIVNETKDKINNLKGIIEHMRIVRAMRGMLNKESEEVDPEEEQSRQELEKEKQT